MENGMAANGKHHHGNGYHDHDDGPKAGQQADRLTLLNWLTIAALVYVSYATWPEGFLSTLGGGGYGGGGRATLLHVWYFGWITALSTGLGTLPFAVVAEMNKWWLGVSNGAWLLACLFCLFEKACVRACVQLFVDRGPSHGRSHCTPHKPPTVPLFQLSPKQRRPPG
jgi:hypothetical protein